MIVTSPIGQTTKDRSVPVTLATNEDPIDVNVSGPIAITGVSTEAKQDTQIAQLTSIDNKLTSPLTVQATNLDVRDLAFATDKVDASGSTVAVSNFPAASVQQIATGQGRTLLFGQITQAASGTTTLVAADATKKVKLVSYSVDLDSIGSLKFSDGTVDLTGVMTFKADQSISMAGQVSSHLMETAAINRPLNIVTVTGKAFGHFSYFLEA